MQQTNELRTQSNTIKQLEEVIQKINTNHINLMESKEIINQFYDKQNNDDKEIVIKHLDEKFPQYLALIQENNPNHQIQFQKLDQYIQTTNQEDVDKFKEKFDEFWSENEINLKEKQEVQFNKNCNIELLKIQNKTKKYIHKSGNQESKEQFLNNLVKKEPSKEDDFDQYFEITSKNLVQENVFDLVFTDKTAKQEINQKPLQDTQKKIYSEQFKDINLQIKNFTNNISISQYSKITNLDVELEYISKTDLDKFLNTKENKDLLKFCENKDKTQAILQFQQFFKIFGYSFDTQKLDEVENLVLVKKEKTLLDYLAYQDNSYYENHLNVSHEFNFLVGLNLSPQKQVIKLYEYKKYIKEFKENQIFIIQKKLFSMKKLAIVNSRTIVIMIQIMDFSMRQ
ncbi:unnamed protein product (macronuclear) [Paramecium tetraurelia]|uniref:Uncharacterized protein n=1 Tax=Paramecium tetraurelia TaxID=5888 RepID=A0C3R9_PARTE|nr:uncharacterized protein GSPATT00034915001 [Paramecium tetraurelia]CAK65436.1 unnamed protein product [Paramecium tetraurelia]|eukprot:XP_001432833.1 hypothetical protein (macronuclear) [Paramecium tetraurelia strain d4-2]